MRLLLSSFKTEPELTASTKTRRKLPKDYSLFPFHCAAESRSVELYCILRHATSSTVTKTGRAFSIRSSPWRLYQHYTVILSPEPLHNSDENERPSAFWLWIKNPGERDRGVPAPIPTTLHTEDDRESTTDRRRPEDQGIEDLAPETEDRALERGEGKSPAGIKNGSNRLRRVNLKPLRPILHRQATFLLFTINTR